VPPEAADWFACYAHNAVTADLAEFEAGAPGRQQRAQMWDEQQSKADQWHREQYERQLGYIQKFIEELPTIVTSSDVHTHHNRRCRSRPAQYHMEMSISNIFRDKNERNLFSKFYRTLFLKERSQP
jgi:hypothetical protein